MGSSGNNVDEHKGQKTKELDSADVSGIEKKFSKKVEKDSVDNEKKSNKDMKKEEQSKKDKKDNNGKKETEDKEDKKVNKDNVDEHKGQKTKELDSADVSG